MSTEITCSLIALAGVVLSALVSFLTAFFTANHKLKELKATWEHDAAVSSDEEFAEMAKAVSKYVASGARLYAQDAAAKVSSVRSQEHGDIAETLDSLHHALLRENRTRADSLLSTAIEMRRNSKQPSKTKKK